MRSSVRVEPCIALENSGRDRVSLAGVSSALGWRNSRSAAVSSLVCFIRLVCCAAKGKQKPRKPSPTRRARLIMREFTTEQRRAPAKFCAATIITIQRFNDFLKYSIVFLIPSSKSTRGSQPRTSLARVISGWRTFGSSTGSGLNSIFDFVPVIRMI